MAKTPKRPRHPQPTGLQTVPDNQRSTVDELNAWFKQAVAFVAEQRRHMREDEEMYWADVEGTRTQFTAAQLDEIQAKYDIPISTKISWAIIEQIVAVLTGGKPAPRLLATVPTTQDFSIMYQQALSACLYENHFGRESSQAIREVITAGESFFHVRKNDFFTESTFNVVGEHLPYRKVFYDPHTTKPDLSDAEYVIIAEMMPVSKAERRYDITIKESDSDILASDEIWGVDVQMDSDIVYGYPADGLNSKHNKKRRYVWVREFFAKQEVNVYIGEGGQVSQKKPVPRTTENPDKAELAAQIAQLDAQMQQAKAAGEQQSQQIAQAQDVAMQPEVSPQEAVRVGSESQRAYDETIGQLDQLSQQLMEAKEQYALMPDEITVYDMTTLSGDTVTVREFFRKREKYVRRWLLLGNRVVEQGIVPCDEYPVVRLVIGHRGRNGKVYGIMHFIKDLVKAMNKFWALLLYDMMISSNRKYFVAEGSIADPVRAEKDMSKPGAFITYQPNDIAKDGGAPIPVEPSPLNPAIKDILILIQQMLEYITGVTQLMQGVPTSATPDSFGGIQTMQSLGSQRVKLYSRWLEDSIERFAYVMTCHLQAYAPKDKIIQFFDEDGDQQEINILSDANDLRFKVRVNMTTNLPTARHMAAQLLGVLGGQTKDPHVQQVLTQYMIEYLDMPESKKMRKEIDAIKNMQGQLEELQSKVQELDGKNRQLQQQMQQKEIELETKLAKAEIKNKVELEKARIEAGQQPEDDPTASLPQPEEDAIPF